MPTQTKPRAVGLVVLAGCFLVAAASGALQTSQPSSQNPARPAPARAGQAVETPEEIRGRIRARVDMVVVPVTVKDRTGRLVLDLGKDDFRVLEDEVEQHIELFSAEPFPLSAVILIDNSLAQKAADQVQKSITAVAAGLSAEDEAAVMLFDELPSPDAEFIPDNDKLFDTLKRLELGSEFSVRAGGPMTAGPRINSIPQPGAPSHTATASRSARLPKHIDDAVFAAAQLLRKTPRDRRRVIFLISDGANAKNNTYKFEDVARALLSADISVYAIGVGDVRFDRGVNLPGTAVTNILQRYALATGGDVFYAGSRQSLESLYAQVSEQARLQYTLGYVANGTDRNREYHDIDIRVKRGGLNLLARQGYYTPLP